jgi:hypothetical protein
LVVHHYRRLHDHLLTSLMYHVRPYTEDAKAVAKDRVYTARIERHDTLHQAGHVLHLFADDRMADEMPFKEVQAHAFRMLARDPLAGMAGPLAGTTRFDETACHWDCVERLAPQFKRHLRPVLLAVECAAPSPHHPLLEAVPFLTTAFQKEKPLGHSPSGQFPVPVSRSPSNGLSMAPIPVGTHACSQTATSFWSIGSCATGWKRGISSGATVFAFAASKTTCSLIDTGRKKTGCWPRRGDPS